MDHDRSLCPRCGEPANEYRFCQACRAHIDSLTGGVNRVAVTTRDANGHADQLLREVERLERALAVASKGISDRIAAGASAAPLQANADRGQAEEASCEANSTPAKMARLPIRMNESFRGLPQGPREVARLEQVLKIAPRTAPSAPTPPEPKQRTVEGPPAEASVAPPEAVELPVSIDVPAPEVPAHVLRAAFWFEQASASKASVADEQPTASTVDPDPVEADAQPWAQDESSEPVSVIGIDRPSRGRWATAISLLVLLGLLAAWLGRDSRRTAGADPS